MSVFNDIRQVTDFLEIPFSILIKMHPNQNKDIFEKAIPKNNPRYIIAEDTVDTNSLLYYSDLVIGIFSSILIESVIMKKKVLRCLIGSKTIDPLESNNIGTVVHNMSELKNEILSACMTK